jgi:hypothetical protein
MKIITEMPAVSNIKKRSLAKTVKGSRLPKIMAFGALMALPDMASSATLTFNLDILFSTDSITPSNPPPWLTVTVTDTVSNQVSLTFSAENLTVGEYVDDWYLNLDLAADQILTGNFTFNETGRSGSFVAPTIEIGSNAFVAGPDGRYDLRFDFANGGGARFGSGEILTYTVTGPAGFNAQLFDTLSAPGSGPYGPYATAAHVNGISNPTPTNPSQTGSAWVAATTVPEPSAGLLGMMGAAACSIFARRRRDSMA